MGLYLGRRKRLHGKERSAALATEGAPSVGPGGEVGAWGVDDEDRHSHAAWRSTDSVIHLTSNLIMLEEDVQ